jgi:hypothetical protein
MPLAIDHLKTDLETRFNNVKTTKDLTPHYRARALENIRALMKESSSLISLSHIPSQKKDIERLSLDLTKKVQNFDATLVDYKTKSATEALQKGESIENKE